MGTLKSSEYAYRSAGDNFDTHPDYRHDMFTMCQEYAKNVSDISSGKAKKFLERAYTQNYWHTADRLAAEQAAQRAAAQHEPGQHQLHPQHR